MTWMVFPGRAGCAVSFSAMAATNPSNGGTAPLDDWLDVCAPAASASGHESPSAIVEVTPPGHSSIFSSFSSPAVCRLLPSVVDDCDVQTQVGD